MKKITTLYKKNPHNLALVLNEVNTWNEWVFINWIPTRKYDWTACAIINGNLYKRFDLKKNRTLPPNSISCQDPDPVTWHHPHWTLCDRKDKTNKYHFEWYDQLTIKEDGTYELCGEKIQWNPEKIKWHKLIKHWCEILEVIDLSFDGLRSFLKINDIEWIVFYNPERQEMCKIRKSDFGIKR